MTGSRSIWLTGAGLMLMTAPVAAQEAAAPAGQLDEILVLARKFAEDIQTTPVAVTAINQATIDNRFAKDLTDLSGLAPNVVLDNGGAFAGTAFLSIRGIGFQDVESSFDPAVGVTVDGIFIGRNIGALMDFFDIEQVEILRGPQGTLFGRNTIGGTINVRSTRPSGTFGFKGQVTVGNIGRLDVRAALDMPIVPEKLAAKVAVFSQNSDGHWRNTYDDSDARAENTDSARASLRFTPSEQLTIDLIGDYSRDRSGSFGLVPQHSTSLTYSPGLSASDISAIEAEYARQGATRSTISTIALAQILQGQAPTLANIIAGLTPANIDSLQRADSHPYDNAYNAPNINKIDSGGIAANISYDLPGGGTFTSITGWRKTDENIVQDFDATASSLFETQRIQDHEQFSQEFNYTSDFSGSPIKLTTGLYYFWQKYHLLQYFRALFVTPTNALGPFDWTTILPPYGIENNDTRQTSRSTAIYAEGTYDVSDRLALVLGGRYTWDNKKFSTLLSQTTLAEDEKSWKQFTPRAIIRFTPSDELMGYASVSRGYKAGGFNGRASTASSIGPFDPEKVTAYELGMKSTLAQNRVRFNVTGFINDYKNMQVETVRPVSGGTGQETVVLNAANARTQGIEVELTAAATSALTFNGSIGYLDAKYKDFTQPVTVNSVVLAGVEEDMTVFKMRRAPKWTLAMGGRYEMPLTDALGLALQLDYRHTSEMFTTVRNQDFGRRRPVGLLDGAIELSLGERYKLSLFGKNLTNEVYVNSALAIGDSAQSYEGETGGFTSYAAKREYGLQLGVKF